MTSQGRLSMMMASVVHEDQKKFGSWKHSLTHKVAKWGEESKIPAEGKDLCKGQRGSAHFLVNNAEISTGGSHCQSVHWHGWGQQKDGGRQWHST